MVTKQIHFLIFATIGSVLAKILMVTKQPLDAILYIACSVLAKILMVTKPQKYGSTFLNVIEY